MEEKSKKEAVDRLDSLVNEYEQSGGNDTGAIEEQLWRTLELFQDEVYYTAKKLQYHYSIRGNEMFVTRKDKSITRATVRLGMENALKLGRMIAGPKKLGCFGASYLYPVFIQIGFINKV